MDQNSYRKLWRDLGFRFGESFEPGESIKAADLLSSMVSRGCCREFKEVAISREAIQFLCAVALSSPTKSDLQQRDIVVIDDPEVKAEFVELVRGESWVRGAPTIIVFCANNRRQRLIQGWRKHEFANDHLDAFFNASVDAAIALSAFVTAAEALGFGCCPISAVRNEAEKVSELLHLPSLVFPVAGLALGFPLQARPTISLRLPLTTTVHENRYSEDGLQETVSAYDQRREDTQPYPAQRAKAVFGVSQNYGWSEDKARQYGLPERENFGAFVKGKGFSLK